jgi:hypothetical protein
MSERLRRKPQPGVESKVLEGKFTRMFELEVRDPDEFVEQTTRDLSEFFSGAGSFVPGRGPAADNGDPAPHVLDYRVDILPNSYVIAHLDQSTKFRVITGTDDKVIGMVLADSGIPYVEEPSNFNLRFGLPTLETTRDGELSIRFEANSGLAHVKITGQEPGALILVATGYLRGLKAGQES